MALEQKALHILFEALAIPAGLLLIYIGWILGNKYNLPMLARIFLIGFGAFNIILDGYLLTTWWKNEHIW